MCYIVVFLKGLFDYFCGVLIVLFVKVLGIYGGVFYWVDGDLDFFLFGYFRNFFVLDVDD